MTLPAGQALITIGAVALATILLRFLPFLLFSGKKQTPKFISYLGLVLPYAAMGLLVVYCIKDVTPLAYPYGAPEAIAVVAVAALQLIKKNALLSIGAGTVLYMVLVQIVF